MYRLCILWQTVKRTWTALESRLETLPGRANPHPSPSWTKKFSRKRGPCASIQAFTLSAKSSIEMMPQCQGITHAGHGTLQPSPHQLSNGKVCPNRRSVRMVSDGHMRMIRNISSPAQRVLFPRLRMPTCADRVRLRGWDIRIYRRRYAGFRAQSANDAEGGSSLGTRMML